MFRFLLCDWVVTRYCLLVISGSFISCIFLSIVNPVTAAESVTLIMEGKTFSVTMPDGLCAIDTKNNEIEEFLFDQMKPLYEPQSHLLLLALPCEAVYRLRNVEDELMDFVYSEWLVLYMPEGDIPQNINRASYIAQSKIELEKLDFSQFVNKINEKYSNGDSLVSSLGISIGEISKVGRIISDDNALYMNIGIVSRSPDGDTPIGAVMSSTLVNGVGPFAAIYQNIDQNFDFTMLHDRMKIFMEDMIARNGTNADVVEATQSHWSSRFSSGIVGAFIGVVIFGGIAFFKLLIRTFRKN